MKPKLNPKSEIRNPKSATPVSATAGRGQPGRPGRAPLLLLAISLLLAPALASADDIPAVINYQGKLTDSAGKALTNGLYTLDFRIWDHPTSTNSADYVWGREFPLYVGSNGMFNVLLSQDGGTLTSPNSTGQVSSLIYAFEQPNRYLGLSIRQVPGGTLSASAPEISPRQQFASAPYAMHAQQASLATSAILANNALSFATYNTNDFLMATKPTQTLKGSLTISNGTLTVNGNVTATALVGYGTIPIGGIVMWSGAATAIPDGWALCDGATSNGRVTPDLRNRFVVGAGSHYAVGDTGGADSVTLTLNQIPSHTHNYTQGERQTFFGHGAYDNMWVDTGATVATTSAGGGQAHENRPPYYALCYIMRVQ